MFRALDDLKPHEVYICTGSSPRYALWGGPDVDPRDPPEGGWARCWTGIAGIPNEILDLNFPTFCMGSFAQDQGPRGKVVDYRVPIEIEGVAIRPGDIVYGDRDGVLVIPAEAAEEAIAKAFEKVSTEKQGPPCHPERHEHSGGVRDGSESCEWANLGRIACLGEVMVEVARTGGDTARIGVAGRYVQHRRLPVPRAWGRAGLPM